MTKRGQPCWKYIFIFLGCGVILALFRQQALPLSDNILQSVNIPKSSEVIEELERAPDILFRPPIARFWYPTESSDTSEATKTEDDVENIKSKSALDQQNPVASGTILKGEEISESPKNETASTEASVKREKVKGEDSELGAKIKVVLEKQNLVTSGKIFKGDKIREFPKNEIKFRGKICGKLSEKDANTLKETRKQNKYSCEKWAVVTTIFEPPSEAVRRFMYRRDWCVVVVGDKGKPLSKVSVVPTQYLFYYM